MGLFSSIGNAIGGAIGGLTGGGNFLSTLGSIAGAVTGNPLFTLGSELAGHFIGQNRTNKANDSSVALDNTVIQRRVRDANAAGIHPLYALGGGSMSPPPIQIGDSDFGSRMGQNLQRASNATATRDTRAVSLQLENMALQNDLLRSQIIQINRPQNPPFPYAESGSIPDLGFGRTAQGGLTPVPSDQMKQRIEDSTLHEIEWYARNRLNPFAILYGPGTTPAGYRWSRPYQQYIPDDGRNFIRDVIDRYRGGD